MFRILTITALLGLLSIVLGAFGAHALKEVLNAEQLESFKTGVFYQLMHVIVIFIVFASSFFTEKQSKTLSYIFLSAIFLFSGSIYAIHLTSIDVKSIWWVTPLGGLLFMLGWGYMIYIFFNKSLKKTD
ncbi:MAG: hypothetical protein CMB99_04100 [Flavobacteriaceae bacterium]|nr:hypothetical protein [Flavobacteriaceae bacterium]|tara:strand:- start:23938 stop:24324 length:387 start_codon:yes stop_codon:yes gene_type:complete